VCLVSNEERNSSFFAHQPLLCAPAATTPHVTMSKSSCENCDAAPAEFFCLADGAPPPVPPNRSLKHAFRCDLREAYFRASAPRQSPSPCSPRVPVPGPFPRSAPRARARPCFPSYASPSPPPFPLRPPPQRRGPPPSSPSRANIYPFRRYRSDARSPMPSTHRRVLVRDLRHLRALREQGASTRHLFRAEHPYLRAVPGASG